MTRSITFIRGWQGRQPGVKDSRLNPGIMATLVAKGFARWADSISDDIPEQISKMRNDTRGRQRR